MKKEWFSKLFDVLMPVFATLAALAVGAVVLLFLGVNPFEALRGSNHGGGRERSSHLRTAWIIDGGRK
jgi:ABC-type uncharacterized transport system permease subunit